MKKIFTIIVVVIVIVGTGYFAFYTPRANNNIVGGDKDEHGCIGSAGYSWCEAKQKCLRVWEESCLSTDAELNAEITDILAKKYGKDMDDVVVNIIKTDDTHAVGTVLFKIGTEQGEGGMVLAIKDKDEWRVVYDGNGSVDCNSLKNTYGFSDDLLVGFCD
jgi:phenylpyruvate tautomerase PptA (4-oxalocrotonate tautomerase family)